MKKLRKLLYGILAAGMFASCSNDELLSGDKTGSDPEKEGEGVYMSLTVKMPSASGSRATTIEPGQSVAGNEVGSNEENNVSNVLLVIATTDNKFIVSGQLFTTNEAGNRVETGHLTPIPNADSYKTVLKLQKTRLSQYYSSNSFDVNNPYVNIFAFCNPTTELLDAVKDLPLGNQTWYDLTYKVTQTNGSATGTGTGIWADNGFLMSNVSIARRRIPASINDWDSYKTEATAFDFSGVNNAGQDTEVDNSATKGRGAVRVQRAVARLDFRDGSRDAADPAEDAEGNALPNTYNVVKNRTGQTIVQIELNRMLLTNMSNQFYYLPRVSDNGSATGAVICGAETPTNYLVGPYWNIFQDPLTANFGTYFNYPFFKAAESGTGYDYNITGWNNYLINDVLEGRGDLYGGTTTTPATPGTYKVWRYVTENVIPGAENQVNSISTGIVFKGRMLATEACNDPTDKYLQLMYNYINGKEGYSLTGNRLTDPTIYSFNGSIYFTWNNVYDQAVANSVVFEKNAAGETVTGEDGKYKIININRSEPLYVAVFGTGGMGTFTYDGKEYTDPDNETLSVAPTSANALWKAWQETPEDQTDNRMAAMNAAIKEMVAQGFTIYQTSEDNGVAGYYCYYFYWNRHNDNGQPGDMGPMEFATVRNNVYKLAVTGIKQLGHPRLPENDPDSPKPDTPDESGDIYLTVTCQVVPWVVRINNIEF